MKPQEYQKKKRSSRCDTKKEITVTWAMLNLAFTGYMPKCAVIQTSRWNRFVFVLRMRDRLADKSPPGVSSTTTAVTLRRNPKYTSIRKEEASAETSQTPNSLFISQSFIYFFYIYCILYTGQRQCFWCFGPLGGGGVGGGLFLIVLVVCRWRRNVYALSHVVTRDIADQRLSHIL